MQVNLTAKRCCPVSIAFQHIHFRLTWLEKSSSSHILSEFTECYKYADDGSVSVIASFLPECLSNMQKVNDYIHSWCKLWRLVINCDPDKTEIIIIRTQKSDQIEHTVVPPVHIGKKRLYYVAESKVLGVTIDEDLSFVQHANLTVRNCWFAWPGLK